MTIMVALAWSSTKRHGEGDKVAEVFVLLVCFICDTHVVSVCHGMGTGASKHMHFHLPPCQWLGTC